MCESVTKMKREFKLRSSSSFKYSFRRQPPKAEILEKFHSVANEKLRNFHSQPF